MSFKQHPKQKHASVSTPLLSAMLILSAASFITGCGTAPSTREPSAATNKPGRAVVVNTAKSVRNNWGGGRLFALVESKGDRWELVQLSESYPRRDGQQEVFLVTRDLAKWETTIAPDKLCQDEETGYSVCTSLLSKPAFFGVKRYDFAAVKQAVNSIPEQQAQAIVAQFISAKAEAANRKYEQDLKRWTTCSQRYSADTNQIEQTASKARSAAIAGEQLSLVDVTAIRSAQQRQSIATVCGFTPQPPRK